MVASVHVGLHLDRVPLPEQGDGDDDLALPERDGGHDRGLDLLDQGLVVVLDQPDLGRGLDGDDPRELEVVELLLEAVDEGIEVVEFLGVQRIRGCFGLGLEGGERAGLQIVELHLPRGQENVEVSEVFVVLGE